MGLCRHYVMFDKFSFWGTTFSTADQRWQSYIYSVIFKGGFQKYIQEILFQNFAVFSNINISNQYIVLHNVKHKSILSNINQFCWITIVLKIDFRKKLTYCCRSRSPFLLWLVFYLNWKCFHVPVILQITLVIWHWKSHDVLLI